MITARQPFFGSPPAPVYDRQRKTTGAENKSNDSCNQKGDAAAAAATTAGLESSAAHSSPEGRGEKERRLLNMCVVT